jgi:hypothetical protein
VPVGSVLAPDDAMTPAPLAPPVKVPYPRAPFIAIAIAALAAIATWLAVWWRRRRSMVKVEQPALTPEERFRNAVIALRRNREHPRRWAALADETRAFLAATRQLGSELTTTELVPRSPSTTASSSTSCGTAISKSSRRVARRGRSSRMSRIAR